MMIKLLTVVGLLATSIAHAESLEQRTYWKDQMRDGWTREQLKHKI